MSSLDGHLTVVIWFSELEVPGLQPLRMSTFSCASGQSLLGHPQAYLQDGIQRRSHTVNSHYKKSSDKKPLNIKHSAPVPLDFRWENRSVRKL